MAVLGLFVTIIWRFGITEIEQFSRRLTRLLSEDILNAFIQRIRGGSRFDRVLKRIGPLLACTPLALIILLAPSQCRESETLNGFACRELLQYSKEEEIRHYTQRIVSKAEKLHPNPGGITNLEYHHKTLQYLIESSRPAERIGAAEALIALGYGLEAKQALAIELPKITNL